MKRTILSALAATALGMGALVAASAPASAQQPVQCPTHAGAFTGSPLAAHDDIKKRGTKVAEYWEGNVAVVDFRIDGRYERFKTNGFQVSRECYNQKPQPPKDAKAPTGGATSGGHRVGFGGFGINLHPGPPGNTPEGKVTVGPLENMS